MNELQQIIELTGMAPVECHCQTCQDMCKRTPCLGTPTDILNLLAAGYRDKLIVTMWSACVEYGIPTIEMVQLKTDPNTGHCVMFENGRCKLHSLGLKPTEGKLADCRVKEMKAGKIPPSIVTALMWESPSQMKTIHLVEMAMGK